MSEEDNECKRCHMTMLIGDGLEQTDYCNLCAQELVIQLEAENKRLKEALSDCVTTYNGTSFPEKQCAINRARMLLKELKKETP